MMECGNLRVASPRPHQAGLATAPRGGKSQFGKWHTFVGHWPVPGRQEGVRTGPSGGSRPPPTPFRGFQPTSKLCRTRKKSCAREGDDGEEGDVVWRSAIRPPRANRSSGFHHRHHRHHEGSCCLGLAGRLSICIVWNTECTASGRNLRSSEAGRQKAASANSMPCCPLSVSIPCWFSRLRQLLTGGIVRVIGGWTRGRGFTRMDGNRPIGAVQIKDVGCTQNRWFGGGDVQDHQGAGRIRPRGEYSSKCQRADRALDLRWNWARPVPWVPCM